MNYLKKMVFNWGIPAIGRTVMHNNKYINVIYYHDVVADNPHSYMRITYPKFETQMKYLAAKGYKTYTFSDLDSEENIVYDPKSILITFDDGWRSNYYPVFNLMKSLGLKYNVYLAAGLIGNDPDYLSWDEVEKMSCSGLCGFGAHTFDHVTMENVHKVDLERQIIQANQLIEQHTGYEPKDFCLPKGIFAQETLNYLLDNTSYSRIYTSNMMYSFQHGKKVIFGRSAISEDEPMHVFRSKAAGQYNVFQKLRGK